MFSIKSCTVQCEAICAAFSGDIYLVLVKFCLFANCHTIGTVTQQFVQVNLTVWVFNHPICELLLPGSQRVGIISVGCIRPTGRLLLPKDPLPGTISREVSLIEFLL